MNSRHILLTGSTGALGRSLVPRLLDDPSIDKIYVLLRTPPQQVLSSRVVPVFGDLRKSESLGLSRHQLTFLQRNLTGILHAAADTRFDAPFAEAHATNVQGTENLLAFASHCARLDRFMHLSTLCAAGKRTGRLREAPLEHKYGFVNNYEATKSASEFLAQRIQAQLPLSIVRLSTVIGSEETGTIHQIGALHRALRLMYCSLVPMMPARPHCPIDLISLEYATGCITELFGDRFTPGSIYHVCSAKDYLPLDEMLDLAYATFAHSRPAWRRRAIERPTVVDLPTFDLFRQTVEATGAPGLIGSLRLLSSFAPQLLYPKTHDDSLCQQALAGTGIHRPDLREFFPRIVASLLTSAEDSRPIHHAHLEAA